MKLGHFSAYLALLWFLAHGSEVGTDAEQLTDYTLKLNDAKGSFYCKPS
jgi:hypothetical protein